MSFNYTLKYRTFQQLLSDIHVDFQNMSLESMIEPQQLIKVVKRVNYDLGLRINKTQETLLEVTKGRVKLPDDFYVLNYALVCDEVSVTQGMPQGTWIEERPLITPYKMTTPGVISTCNDGTVNCCGTCSQQFGNCGCATPTCGQCTQPVQSCGCSSTTSECNTLLPLPSACTTNTVVTNSSTSSSSTVYNYCWNDVVVTEGYTLAVYINGTPTAIPVTTGAQMQTYLNNLGLGTWTVTETAPTRFTFCVDTTLNIFGNMVVSGGDSPVTTSPVFSSSTNVVVTNNSVAECTCGPGCEVETETSTTSANNVQVIQNCCWDFEADNRITGVTVEINGTTYTVPFDEGTTASIAYLNGLNLGVWTITSDTGIFSTCVTGNGSTTYGVVTITSFETIVIEPTCTVSTITTTVNNITTTCNCIPSEVPVTPEPVAPTCTTTTDPCVKPRVILNCKGDCYELVQIVNLGITRTYKRLIPITILENPQMVDCGCPNLYWKTTHSAWIRDGWLYTTLKDAVIYISYQGQMQDEDGNLMCPDHDEINEYYEYAVKQRILENLIMNDEPVGQKMALVEARLRAARNYALTIVNTPNFSEMKQVWAANRKAMYGKYYDQFKSFGPVPAIVPTNNFINGYNK